MKYKMSINFLCLLFLHTQLQNLLDTCTWMSLRYFRSLHIFLLFFWNDVFSCISPFFCHSLPPFFSTIFKPLLQCPLWKAFPYCPSPHFGLEGFPLCFHIPLSLTLSIECCNCVLQRVYLTSLVGCQNGWRASQKYQIYLMTVQSLKIILY